MLSERAIRIKELLHDHVNMGTYGLVELELIDYDDEIRKLKEFNNIKSECDKPKDKKCLKSGGNWEVSCEGCKHWISQKKLINEKILYWAKQLEHKSLSVDELVKNAEWLLSHIN